MLIVEYPYIVATLCDVNPAIYFFKQENSATRQFFINLIIYYKKFSILGKYLYKYKNIRSLTNLKKYLS